MVRTALIPSLALLLSSGFLMAQAPKPDQPRPEHRRLAYFAGAWNFRLEMKPSPFGPGGTVTGTDYNDLLPGGFFLVRRYETKSPVGEFKGLEERAKSSSRPRSLESGLSHSPVRAVAGKLLDQPSEKRDRRFVFLLREQMLRFDG